MGVSAAGLLPGLFDPDREYLVVTDRAAERLRVIAQWPDMPHETIVKHVIDPLRTGTLDKSYKGLTGPAADVIVTLGDNKYRAVLVRKVRTDGTFEPAPDGAKRVAVLYAITDVEDKTWMNKSFRRTQVSGRSAKTLLPPPRPTRREEQNMKFEEFAGTGDEGKYVGHFNDLDRTTASQGSRADANAHPAGRVSDQSYLAEYTSLVARQQLIEVKLSEDADELRLRHKEHMAARRPIDEWVQIERQAFTDRQRMVQEKTAIQRRIVAIKEKAMREKREAYQRHGLKAGTHGDITNLVTLAIEIRDLLAAMAESLGVSVPKATTPGPTKNEENPR